MHDQSLAVARERKMRPQRVVGVGRLDVGAMVEIGGGLRVDGALPQAFEKRSERQNIGRFPGLQTAADPVGVEFTREFLRKATVRRDDCDAACRTGGKASE